MNKKNINEEKTSFIFYKSFYEAIKRVDDTTKLEVFNAICELALYGNRTSLNGISEILFCLIEPQILANNKKYSDGRKGGRPTKKTTGYENKITTGYSKTKTTGYENKKPNVNENDNENENDNVNDNENENILLDNNNEKKSSHFEKPTIEEIQNYCLERNNGINAEQFYNYYEAKGWLIGKNKMKSWQACIRTWEIRNKQDKIKRNDYNNLIDEIIE